jgi:hypothetical protein
VASFLLLVQADAERKNEPVASAPAPIAEEPEAEAAAAQVIVAIQDLILYLIYQPRHRLPDFIMS